MKVECDAQVVKLMDQFKEERHLDKKVSCCQHNYISNFMAVVLHSDSGHPSIFQS